MQRLLHLLQGRDFTLLWSITFIKLTRFINIKICVSYFLQGKRIVFLPPLNVLTYPSGVLISIPHPVALGFLRPHSSEEDVQPPGSVHRRASVAPRHP